MNAEELHARMLEIGELLRTQDNRITDQPVFTVQQRKRVYGFDPGWTDGDGFIWVHDGNEVTDPERIAELEREYKKNHIEPQDHSRTYYKDHWEFVTCCFTEKACQDYIAANGHNLKEPRIYVESAYRNDEWKYVREYLKQLK